MQQTKFISDIDVENSKNQVLQLYKQNKEIVVLLKKSNSNYVSYNAIIEGVYQKFFVVKDVKLKANFTIQYFELISGDVLIKSARMKEGI